MNFFSATKIINIREMYVNQLKSRKGRAIIGALMMVLGKYLHTQYFSSRLIKSLFCLCVRQQVAWQLASSLVINLWRGRRWYCTNMQPRQTNKDKCGKTFLPSGASLKIHRCIKALWIWTGRHGVYTYKNTPSRWSMSQEDKSRSASRGVGSAFQCGNSATEMQRFGCVLVFLEPKINFP